jgi:prepilin-type processing-associated H-X9-DG protein
MMGTHFGGSGMPRGGNFLFEDGHVDWMKANVISIGAAGGALGPYVCFFNVQIPQ